MARKWLNQAALRMRCRTAPAYIRTTLIWRRKAAVWCIKVETRIRGRAATVFAAGRRIRLRAWVVMVHATSPLPARIKLHLLA